MTLAEAFVDQYLDRIGFPLSATGVTVDLSTLEALQRAHLSTVPFENLDVYNGVRVSVDPAWSVPKIVERRRGGWCFENNGAFAELLDALGFPVLRLGAAVLLEGPNRVIDHLALEVQLDEPYLVDVGFGDSFIRPLRLNHRGPQDGGSGTFELIDSAEGVTLTEHRDGAPVPLYRFRRVDHAMDDFTPASDRLQDDKTLHWSQKPFATRLIDGGPDRVTLLGDRLKLRRDGEETVTPVSEDTWTTTHANWFS